MDKQQLLQLLQSKKEEARGLLAAGELDKAEAITEEIRKINKQLSLLQEIEDDEQRQLLGQENRGNNVAKADEVRSVVKHLLGLQLTDEERAIVVSSDVGTLIPQEYMNRLIELRKGFAPLKDYCDVIPVNRAEGTMPVVDLEQNEMEDLTEGEDIQDGSLVTTDISYKVATVGLLNKFSFESVEDAVIALEEIATKNFAEISVRKENRRIMNVVETGATNSTSTKTELHQKIKEEMAKIVPSAKNGLVTIVNTKAYTELDNKEDKNGRPLNLITRINDVEYFNNKPLILVDDVVLADQSGTKMFAFVANMKEAVKFFDRKQVTIAKAEKFENGAKMVRVLERFDVKAGPKRSLIKIEMADA